MKSLNSFINFRSSRPNLQSSYISLDRWLTVGSPSGLDAKMKQKSKMLRYAVVVLFVLTLGAGNVLGTTPTLDDLEFSTSNSVRIVNEDFNSLNTVTKTATVAITKTDQTEYGVFNCIYNNNTSNSYKIVNNENGFSDKSMSLSAGSGSPLIMHITDKTWGAKGAFRIKTTKTSTEYIGFYGETSGSIYAKAKSTVYLSVASGSVGIHNGGTGKSDGFVNVGSYSTDIIDICVIYNTTNSATTYGDNISLAANKAHVYINGTCVMDGASPKAFAIAQTTLTSFRVAPQASSGNKAYVDDVQIWNALPTAAETCTPLGSVNGSISRSQTKPSKIDSHLVIISVFQRSFCRMYLLNVLRLQRRLRAMLRLERPDCNALRIYSSFRYNGFNSFLVRLPFGRPICFPSALSLAKASWVR